VGTWRKRIREASRKTKIQNRRSHSSQLIQSLGKEKNGDYDTWQKREKQRSNSQRSRGPLMPGQRRRAGKKVPGCYDCGRPMGGTGVVNLGTEGVKRLFKGEPKRWGKNGVGERQGIRADREVTKG